MSVGSGGLFVLVDILAAPLLFRSRLVLVLVALVEPPKLRDPFDLFIFIASRDDMISRPAS